MDEKKLQQLASEAQNAFHLVEVVKNALSGGEGRNEFSDSYVYVLTQAENKLWHIQQELTGEDAD